MKAIEQELVTSLMMDKIEAFGPQCISSVCLIKCANEDSSAEIFTIIEII